MEMYNQTDFAPLEPSGSFRAAFSEYLKSASDTGMYLPMPSLISTASAKDHELSVWLMYVLGLCLAYLVLSNLWRVADVVAAKRSDSWIRSPPLLPFGIPVLGHSLYFLYDMPGFSLLLGTIFHDIPVKISLFVMDTFVITTPKDVVELFKKSAQITNKPYRKFVSNAFDVPEEFKAIFDADTSGLRDKPIAGVAIQDENRVDYLMHTYITQFLSGPNLGPLGERLASNLVCGLEAENIGYEWTDIPCLYLFIRDKLFPASITAMFGEQLFRISPTFCEDFWVFEEKLPDLAKGYPRWMNRQDRAARDRCLRTVEMWANSLDSERETRSAGEFVYDPILGSDIVQKRHSAFAKIKGITPRARACEDLGLIWAVASNVTHATFWLVFQILSDPEVLSRFRDSITPAIAKSAQGSELSKYSISSLCASPYLQSLYAETLRLYTGITILRSPLNDNFRLGRWRFSRGDVLSVMNYALQRNEKVYNTGSSQDKHPLSEFWADRFLVPSPQDKAKPPPTGAGMKGVSSREFSLRGLEGSWLPYGGGANMCPGRQYAKQEMILTAALLPGNYDIELIGTPADINVHYYGTGTFGVKGKQQARIRRRRV